MEPRSATASSTPKDEECKMGCFLSPVPVERDVIDDDVRSGGEDVWEKVDTLDDIEDIPVS
jgi:hypothetical protein